VGFELKISAGERPRTDALDLAAQRSLGGHELKDEVERVVAMWLITQDTGGCQMGREKLFSD
jgi:hypothetical protein